MVEPDERARRDRFFIQIEKSKWKHPMITLYLARVQLGFNADLKNVSKTELTKMLIIHQAFLKMMKK